MADAIVLNLWDVIVWEVVVAFMQYAHKIDIYMVAKHFNVIAQM